MSNRPLVNAGSKRGCSRRCRSRRDSGSSCSRCCWTEELGGVVRGEEHRTGAEPGEVVVGEKHRLAVEDPVARDRRDDRDLPAEAAAAGVANLVVRLEGPRVDRVGVTVVVVGRGVVGAERGGWIGICTCTEVDHRDRTLRGCVGVPLTAGVEALQELRTGPGAVAKKTIWSKRNPTGVVPSLKNCGRSGSRRRPRPGRRR